jgi:CRISPR-associated endoribonuclease Cas6
MEGRQQAGTLASVVLIVTPTSTQTWDPLQVGHFLRAFFYDTVTLSNPALADSLHDLNGLKPFSVSLPLPWKLTAGHTASARSAPSFYVRFTALTGEVYQALTAGLIRRCHASSQLSLGPHTVDIQQVLFTKGASGFCNMISYGELYDGPLARTIHMRFLTPTSFRSGRGNLPFPLPVSLYRSLWQKWQRFAPSAFQLDERVVPTIEQSLFPARYSLGTETASLKGIPQVGCVGTCQFQLLEEVSEKDRRAITALSRFAAYAGVGMKTTMGMGHTLVEIEKSV